MDRTPASWPVARHIGGRPPPYEAAHGCEFVHLERLSQALTIESLRLYAALARPRRARGARDPDNTLILYLWSDNGARSEGQRSSISGLPAQNGRQPSEKVYRIGMLERTSKTLNAASLNGFLRGMQELGYVEGKHFVIEYRSADGLDERFPQLAADLVRVKVDLIVTRGTQAILATKNSTNTIPIVITGAGDPIAQGMVASLARPGGNITGLNPMVTELYPKRVELLRALVPKPFGSRPCAT